MRATWRVHAAWRWAALAWLASLPVQAADAIKPGVDYHSFANVADFRVRHVDLDLDVNFDARRLAGRADLTVSRLGGAATALVLDTRALTIRSVALISSQGAPQPLAFRLGEAREPLGQPLRIEVPPSAAKEFRLRIEYQTAPEASGLQWLTPGQTAGKKHPYLFSQSQAIHARSWIPLQDSPQVRVTCRATIRTPPGLRAVMSAAHVGDAAKSPFGFEMKEPIPSYLIAIAVGDIGFRAIGARAGVYTEPSMLDAAAKEFADLEAMMQATEKLFGPYRWGRYDVLILPPSFPFGGMENPRLTFATPTIIAGDKSLVAVIAHELAHSWSGNLVTNATWRDFWLNEGFTTYLERRIVEAIYGKRREQMEDVLGVQSLRRDMARLPPDEEHLAIDLRGRDPDDGVTEVAYEKGKLFVQWLESRHGRASLDAFLRGYFDRFAFQSISTEQFLEYLHANLLNQKPGAVTEAQLHAWIHEPGLPAFAVLPPGNVFEPIDTARASWLGGKVAASKLPTSKWSTQEWLHFLDNMPAKLPRAKLEELDEAFSLTGARNAEIAHSWFRVAIRNAYEPAYPQLERYLTSIGRRKLIRPLYEDLMKTPQGTALARRIYAKARSEYHPIAVTTIDGIVNAKTP
jgi:leukotriene-A4 hydrolase